MKKALAVAVLTLVSVASHGSTIFSDDFDANVFAGNPFGYNMTPVGWSVTNGTVDVIPANQSAYYGCSSTCIDLDGTSGDAGILSKALGLTAGVTYTASFELAGNHRGQPTPSANPNWAFDTGTITFGTQSLNYSLPAFAGFSFYQLAFTPAVSGIYSLNFSNHGGDNVGAMLDNVSVNAVSSVPEPETYALLLVGLGLMCSVVRRRKAQQAV
ncbi:MAG: PEP-CTERM sorting domain-containing protein [Pseudomonadota bacterium]